jgi:hypothetical protein
MFMNFTAKLPNQLRNKTGGEMKKILVLLLFAIFVSSGTASARPTAKITIRAIDEQGVVIGGAKVTVGFVIPNSTGIGTTEIHKKGHTDSNGEFSASSGSMHLVGFSVDKEGYYQSGSGYEFTSRSLLLNRWEPWNPTIEVVLKKKRNPVGMYIGGTNWVEVPALEKPVGYDLEKGDWVAPYGRGMSSDFVFTFWSDIRAYREYDLKMTLEFGNKHDGIQEFQFNNEDQSYYKWPFEAPVDGYQQKLVKAIHKIPGKTETNINRSAHYIFRVRTMTDQNGNVISAKYGKVTSEFELSPEGSEFAIKFSYILNPDGTRNLEEDPEKNLFKKK